MNEIIRTIKAYQAIKGRLPSRIHYFSASMEITELVFANLGRSCCVMGVQITVEGI